MKNNHSCSFSSTPTFQYPAYIFQLLFAAIIFNCTAINSAQAQSQMTTFEIAVALDSLYEESLDDTSGEAAQEFFEKLMQHYDLEDIESARGYFTDNYYLHEKVGVCYDQLVSKTQSNRDRKGNLEVKKENLEVEVFDYIKALCNENIGEAQTKPANSPCPYNQLLQNAIKESFGEPNIVQTIQLIKKELSIDTTYKSKDKKEVRGQLERFEDEIIKLRAEIVKIKDEPFRISSGSNTGLSLALNGSYNLPIDAPAPIVIQTPGSSSLESSIIDGTSKWIAERMREELSIAFFERFEIWVEEKNIKTLFPNTFSSFKSSITTDYALMIQIFRSAFEKDLDQLPFHLTDYLVKELAYYESLDLMVGKIIDARNDIKRLDTLIQNERIISNAIYDKIYRLSPELDSLYNIIYGTTQTIDPAIQLAYDALENKQNQLYAEANEIESKIYSFLDEQYLKQEILYNNNGYESEAFKILKYVMLTTKALEILSEGKHPTNLMSFLRENVDEMLPDAGSIKPSIIILDEVSKSLIRTGSDGNSVWLSRPDQNRLKENPHLLKIYLGLLSQDVEQGLYDEIYGLTALREEIISNLQYSGDLPGEKSYMTEMVTSDIYNLLDNIINNVNQQNTDSIGLAIDNFFDNTTYWYDVEIPEFKQEYIKKEFILKVEEISSTPATQRMFTEYALHSSAYKKQKTIFGDSLSIILDYYQNPFDYYSIAYVVEEVASSSETELDLYDKEKWEEADFIKFELVAKKKLDIWLLETIEDTALIANFAPLCKNYLEYYLRYLKVEKNTGPDIEIFKGEISSILLIPFIEMDKIALQSAIDQQPDIVNLDIRIKKAYANLDYAKNLLINERSLLSIIGNFLQFADRLDNLRKGFDELKEKDRSSIGPQEKVYLLRSSLEALDQVFNIALQDESTTLRTVQGLSSNVIDAYTAVLEKDYDGVVMNVMYIADSILELSYRHRLNTAESDIGQLISYRDSLIKSADFKEMGRKEKKELKAKYNIRPTKQKNPELNEKYNLLVAEKERKHQRMQEIFKYGAFLAAVVESNNSEEIKNAIRAISLPAGSYNIKRRNKFNISLNAYPGITGGMEEAYTPDESQWAGNLGFTAPVGLAVSWGYTSKIDGFKYLFDKKYSDRIDRSSIVEGGRYANGHSGSAYFSLIDLGAIVLFRFDNETDPLPTDIGFQQIFSPGVSYVHGFPNIPISAMLGLQLSPQLREIDEVKANSLRINASIVVDLPMANFHTTKRYSRR